MVISPSSPVTLTGEPETLLEECLLLLSLWADVVEFGVDVFLGVSHGEQLRSSRFRVETLRSRGCSPVDFFVGSDWK